jgi:periodic tryptophan protein 1
MNILAFDVIVLTCGRDKDEDMEVINDGGDVEGLYGLDDYETDEGVKTTVGGLAGLMYYANEDDDPYITLKDEEDEEEKEDYIIRPDDNLLLVGKAQEEFSSIEVHVFNWRDNHCYCHHEIMINDHPLVIEWLDYDPEQPDVKGNMIAVGGMSPVIEVWDLDLVDGLEPVCVLGTSLDAMTTMMKEAKKKLKKKSREKIKKKDLEEMAAAKINKKINGHIDAVIDLSWNRSVRNLLASSSADSSVKVWDLSTQCVLLSLQHPDKVQSVEWHKTDISLLATGCSDGVVRLYNCEDGSLVTHWKLSGEIEKVLWNYHIPDHLLVSSDNCQVYCLNKSTGNLQYTIDAHSKSITGNITH